MGQGSFEYENFKYDLSKVLGRILSDTPYDKIHSGREDFRADEYRLQNYTITFNKMQVFFNALSGGDNLADIDQHIYNAKYIITLKVKNVGKVNVGTICRRPKPTLEFHRKPYQSAESFVYGCLERTVREICPHIVVEINGRRV